MEDPKDFAPCVFDDNGSGTFSLSFTDFDPTTSIFEERGLDGGGYG